MIFRKFENLWTCFWMHYAGLSPFGRIATRLATWFAPPYYGRCYLARLNQKGYIAPSATIYHNNLRLSNNVFIGDRVVIYQDKDGGPVDLGERVHIYGETFIQTGSGGSLEIGSNTHIHPHCQISAYKSPIYIGCDVQIAPNCAFYPYDHSFAPGKLITEQPLQTKGGIIVEDDAWLGFGVIVLDGVRIGKGAVIGAGSVVTYDVPDGAIAVGVPARVVKMRSDLAQKLVKRPEEMP
jgi:acetyltransferase-like isoleucine patch superfamily enzyme